MSNAKSRSTEGIERPVSAWDKRPQMVRDVTIGKAGRERLLVSRCRCVGVEDARSQYAMKSSIINKL